MKKNKMYLKRIIALFISFILSSGTSIYLVGGADNSYRFWKQSDARWKNIFVGQSGRTISQIGCALTSLAILIVHSGCASEDDFNPGILCEYLNSNNGFSSGGAITWSKSQGLVPEFKFSSFYTIKATEKAEKAAEINDLLNQGYYVISNVKNGGHWVAVDYVSEDNVYIMDPATNSNTKLFDSYDYNGVTQLRLFKSEAARPVQTSVVTAPTTNVPTVTTSAQPEKTNGVYWTSGNVFLRSTPSTELSPIACISRGTVLSVIGLSGNWGKVEYNDKIGWVSMSYTNYMCQANIRETGIYKTTANLNFRELPSIAYASYEVIALGTEIEVTAVCGDWGRISYNGQTGWVSLKYASYIKSAADKVDSVSTQVTEAPVTTAPPIITTTAPPVTSTAAPTVTTAVTTTLTTTEATTVTTSAQTTTLSSDISPVVVKGDIDGNGVVNAIDMALAQQAISGNLRLNGIQMFTADMDGNGSFSISDFIAIRRLVG